MRLTAIAKRSCPICGGATVETLHQMRFTLPERSPLPDAYYIVACEACGFVYADTPGNQRDYDRYYSEHSKYGDPTVATGGSQDVCDRARIEKQADRIAAEVSKDDRILDIGCASGGLLLALRDRGFPFLYGVDGVPACIEQLGKCGIPAALLRLSELSQSGFDGKFDLVIVSHVLEHVVDLKPLLTAAKSLLAETGRIYVETPDASRYDPVMFVPYYFFDCEHINHFDTYNLSELARAVGLHPMASGQTVLEVAEAMHYPACWAWLSLSEGAASTIERDDVLPLRESIRKYITDSAARESYPILAALEESQEPVIVWGAGSFSQRLFSGSPLGHCNIIGIVDKDSNKRGKTFAGFTVTSPKMLLGSHPEATVLVAAAVQFEAIAEEARRMLPTCNVVNVRDK
jgi:2-polyprenyl-3-methyl-5-hydroxy-6-metoxy-1,4-benzoquinol methylase